MELFSRSKSTNSRILEQAFDRYYPAIFRFFRFRGASAEEANDLAASVFERALIYLPQYDPAKAQIQTWLFTIARNLSINHWKAERDLLPLEDDLPNQDDLPLEDQVIYMQDKERIYRALQALDQRSHEMVALKFGAQLMNREIADITGLSESHIGVILYRSILKLRAILSLTQKEAHHG